MENLQHDIENDIVKPIRAEIVLTKEKFKELYTFLNIIKPHFNDLCIVDGKFRTRSNDLVCIVETEFSYFKGVEFYIADIKMLVKMLSTLDKKAAITIVLDDTIISFTDGYQKAQVIYADPEFIENKFMTDEEMQEFLDNNVDFENLLIKSTLPKSIVYNINKITKDFNVNAIKVRASQNDLNKGSFYISNQRGYGHRSTDSIREYTINLKENFIIPIEKEHFLNITSLPFIFNKADMTFCYYFNKDKTMIATIYNTTVDGLLIYAAGRAALFEESK